MKFKLELIALVTVSLLWVASCNSVVDPEIISNTEVLTSNVGLGDSDNITVHLADDVAPVTRTFDDLDHLHHFIDSVDTSGHVLLNKGLYLKLKHALYPSEIATLDADGVAIVGTHKYVISEDAVSRLDLEKLDGELEIETYHGKSGRAYLDEFAAVANNIGNLDNLNNFQFKDPEIESIYSHLKYKISNKTTNIDREYYGPTGTDEFPFTDPTTGQIDFTLGLSHERGYIFWNQSTGRFTRRAIAHTSLLFRPPNSNRWHGYAYGHYGQNLSSYNSTNFVSTTVDGGKGKATCSGTFECTVRAKRKRRRGSVSWHTSGYHYPTTDSPSGIPSSIVLDYYDVEDYYLE
ncbi:MAG: hypothetical protein F4069_08990 [Rhodothermaceae bacterium]|nr:hypothetical protein [Rhodothermaceae bacterium]MYG68556.1 hypothetical protein [Rhodothermaceae bacterium]MYJ45442.1 hypothetical protein [Rhodothermaceae bacterium]